MGFFIYKDKAYYIKKTFGYEYEREWKGFGKEL